MTNSLRQVPASISGPSYEFCFSSDGFWAEQFALDGKLQGMCRLSYDYTPAERIAVPLRDDTQDATRPAEQSHRKLWQKTANPFRRFR